MAAELANLPGVYCIRCIPTGRVYVGSAVRISVRWKVHQKVLRSGRGNSKLRRAWNKYGEESFSFEVLEVVSDRAMLLDREQHYMDALDAVTKGFNCRPKAESNLGIKYGPISDETRAKISEANRRAHRGKPGPMIPGSKHTASARKAMSEGRRRNAPKVDFGGRSMNISEWASAIGVSARGLTNRLRRKWPLERALTEKSRGY